MNKVNQFSTESDYLSWLKEIKAKVYTLQIKASVAVNVELLSFYWELGREITEKQAKTNWGEAIVEQLSNDLLNALPDVKGFSISNLFYVKKWYLFYNEHFSRMQQLDVQNFLPSTIDNHEKIQQLVGQIPWGHNILIITKIKNINEAVFYAQETLINGWSRALTQHIQYVPFGEVFVEERTNSWSTPYKFNGKELDEETGLYYFHARYYDPRLSVWMSVDPLAEKFTGWSSYVYCHNIPTRIIDPTGESGEDTTGKPSEINKITGVPTAAQSSARVNEPKQEVNPIPYIKPIFRGKIKDSNKENFRRMHNAAMNDPVKKQCLTDPTLQTMAVGALGKTVAVAAPELSKATVQILKEKGMPVILKGVDVTFN